jgi:hypothetical protein
MLGLAAVGTALSITFKPLSGSICLCAAMEEDMDPNAEAGRRVRARPAEPEGTADAAAMAAGASAQQQKPREQIHISRQRWQYLHSHVLGCLKQAEAGEMDDRAAEIKVAAQKFIGLSQHDIIKWHIRTELEKCAPLFCSS